MKTITNNNVIDKIHGLDASKWAEEAQQKSTQSIYEKFKKNEEESWFDNREGSCGYETETLEHILLDCHKYNDKVEFNSIQEIESRNRELGNILAFDRVTIEELETSKKNVKRLWNTRKRNKNIQVKSRKRQREKAKEQERKNKHLPNKDFTVGAITKAYATPTTGLDWTEKPKSYIVKTYEMIMN